MSKNEQNTPDTAPQEEKTSFVKEFLSWVEVIVVAVVLAFFLVTFIIVNATVPSGSMENTIMPGDRLLGLRLTYYFSSPKRGDIAVFHYPVDDELLGKKTNYIKRVIGLPGETVEIRNAKIYINGSDEPLDEPYLKEEWTVMNDGFTYEIPEDCYLMIGDNRNNSSDARYWPYRAVETAAENGLTITAEEAWNLSFVRKDQFVGKAYLRYWPLTKIGVLH